MNKNKLKFPGMSIMTVGEVGVFARILKDDGYTTEESLEFLQGLDRCLTIQASAAMINQFVGKAKWNRKTARHLLFKTAM